jgi:hypothetical protein
MPRFVLVLLFDLSIATASVWAQEDTETIQHPARSQAAASTRKDSTGSSVEPTDGLWPVCYQTLKSAKYIDLTHAITPSIPVWRGFAPSRFGPALHSTAGRPFRYAADGFEATHYDLGTD